MKRVLLRDLIEASVTLGRESEAGFRAVRCQACNDHSERAGFKFDGATTGFNCFNCQAKFIFVDGSTSLSADAKRILNSFGIAPGSLDELTGSGFFVKQPPTEITVQSLKPTVNLFTPEVALPPQSFALGVAHSEEIQAPLIEYLFGRALDPLVLAAHFSLDRKFLNRVIIPCTRDGKVIYWQARALGEVRPRYLSPGTNKDAVLWGYDNLFRSVDEPLFITEGIFDAASVAGVALLGSTLNESKLAAINKSRCRKIVIIDRDKNGAVLALLALQNSWEITFPPEGVQDVNASVQKYGLLFTILTLVRNTTIPNALKSADGLTVKSKLELGMQLAMARLSRKKNGNILN